MKPKYLGWGLMLAVFATAWAQSPPGLSLEQAFTLLRQSPGWRSADLGVAAAEQTLAGARAASGLSVSAGAEPNLSRDISAGSTASFTNLSATVAANVLPWSPGRDAVRAAERGLERAISQRDETRSGLVVSLAERYFTVRLTHLDLALAERGRALAERRLQIVQSQAALGQVRQDTILNAQLALQEAVAKVGQARSGLELSRRGLATLLGQPVGEVALTSPPPEATAGVSLEALLRRALERRPDLVRAVSALRDAEDSLGIARRDRWLPQANLQMFYGQAGQQGAPGGPLLSGSLDFKSGDASLTASTSVFQNPAAPAGSTAFGFRLGVSVPLYSPALEVRIDGARTGLEAARLSLELTRQEVELEVRQRYGELKTAQAGLGANQTALEGAKQRLSVAEARLQSGLGTAVEVEAARLGVLQAERELFGAQVNLYLASLRLQNAAGFNLGGN